MMTRSSKYLPTISYCCFFPLYATKVAFVQDRGEDQRNSCHKLTFVRKKWRYSTLLRICEADYSSLTSVLKNSAICHHNVNLILTVKYSTRILNESKQLTNDLRRNRDYYGAGDIFTQKNIDLCNQYLNQMEMYTMKDLKRVSHLRGLFLPWSFLYYQI